VDRGTLNFYQTRAREWAAHLPHDHSRWLDAFLDELPQGARILELGCGDGRDAAWMIERGFDVHPSDGAPEMARLASERLGRVVPVMRFDEVDACEEYDAVWSQAALLHVAERDLSSVLARVHRALKPGGRHWASYKDGTGGKRDEVGRFFSYIAVDRLEAAYRAAAPWSELTLGTRQGASFYSGATLWHEVHACK
jgi:SAM-dependent methyltransferase